MRAWKEGDKCFYEGKLGEVDHVEGGEVKCVSAGGFLTGGASLAVFPVTLQIRELSIRFNGKMAKLGEVAGVGANLNPAIYQALYFAWETSAKALCWDAAGSGWSLEHAIEHVEASVDTVIDLVRMLKAAKFGDIPLLRQ